MLACLHVYHNRANCKLAGIAPENYCDPCKALYWPDGMSGKPKHWRWYVARTVNGKKAELMIDLEDKSKGDKPPERLRLSLDRLMGLINNSTYGFDSAYLYPSTTKYHSHLIVVMSEPIEIELASMLEARLCDDLYRNQMNRYRDAVGCGAGSLLITSEPWPGFYRRHDDECSCSCAKHTNVDMEDCPAAQRLRGMWRLTEFYPRPEPFPWTGHYGKIWKRGK